MERLTEYHCGVAVIKDKNRLKDAMQKLANYEDLEEQGLLHKAPLKNGTPICHFVYSFEEVTYLVHTTYLFGVTEYEIGELGRDFWLNEEEALKADAEMEKALAEMEKGND